MENKELRIDGSSFGAGEGRARPSMKVR